MRPLGRRGAAGRGTLRRGCRARVLERGFGSVSMASAGLHYLGGCSSITVTRSAAAFSIPKYLSWPADPGRPGCVADFGLAYRLRCGSQSDPYRARTRLPVYRRDRDGIRQPGADAGTATAVAQPELPPTNLPEPISELIGRDDVLGEILRALPPHIGS